MADVADDSILSSTKKILGMDEDYTVFDMDVITHINSVFSDLQQLGVGPTTAFYIDDATKKWADFISDDMVNLRNVRSYMWLRVKLLFDPPTTSFAIDSLKNQAKEFEWRMNVQAEGGI